MHWRFDPLFSIAVFHTKYTTPDPDSGESPRRAPDFVLEPSPSTAIRLRQCGWICKSGTGSCTVYGEKIFEANGTAVLRSKPGAETGLTFMLRLKNAALLDETKPFVLDSDPVLVPNPNLPAFSGRSRLLYFDNRNPTPLPDGALRLIPGPVDTAQFGSRAPTPFEFTKPKPGTSDVSLTPLAPSGAPLSFPINTATNSVRIEVPENGYQLVQKPGNQTEMIYFTNDPLPGNILGVIRIFEPPAGWGPQQRYQIIFEKV